MFIALSEITKLSVFAFCVVPFVGGMNAAVIPSPTETETNFLAVSNEGSVVGQVDDPNQMVVPETTVSREYSSKCTTQ